MESIKHKDEITMEKFIETYCNSSCKIKKCEGIGTTWSVCCPYQSGVKFIEKNRDEGIVL